MLCMAYQPIVSTLIPCTIHFSLLQPLTSHALQCAGFIEMQRSCRAQYAARKVLQGKLREAVARATQAEKDRAAAAAASVTHLHDLEKLRRDVRLPTHFVCTCTLLQTLCKLALLYWLSWACLCDGIHGLEKLQHSTSHTHSVHPHCFVQTMCKCVEMQSWKLAAVVTHLHDLQELRLHTSC